jgi:DNA-binding CsgD family transcriptional regulator
VVPLPQDEPGMGDARGRRPAVAVLVGGPGTAPDAGALRAAFGLSAAEARVLRAVAGGAGVPSAAAALGGSQETVRTHLARCFDATGTRTQAALAALVARLPGSAEERAANDP